MNKENLRLLMVATFRYSLGRRTYMPSFIVDIIIKNHKIFNKYDWKLFIDEINEIKDLGDNFDVEVWNKLKSFSKIRMEKKGLRIYE